ncbi:MAG: ribonuclease P protein component [Sulfurimicrobium sp.]|nr:ribonuclease P protein component [Sulfurimicrobium sp.]MDP1705041.1 ribonuclease P protein component [Sulfurimicrobium sp.]MDP2199976.1 ribonuclease P protein component [Sulfurimicrobium sp.]MDP3688959.1 ribonuclease P protein component [Sulfurimicrobium sp.]
MVNDVVEGFGLSKAKHLVKTDEISSVFSFNSRVSSEHFQVLAKPGTNSFARVAVIVSKKTVRRACARNYIKRVSREIFRLQQYQLSGVDMVIRVRKGFSAADYALINLELRELMKRVQDKFMPVEGLDVS